ncbi:MAG TPA: cytochrome c biogenesis protein CcdA [Gemmatimonadaceae bacterium]|nr:cytochrome c biogenesis protein CcdA [Gemmatimonadaceae bacterium]
MTPDLSFGVAFTAGVLSFLSPCVLPLIPSYITFLTGMSVENVEGSRRNTLIHASLFILGFTAIFLALGATATMLGQMMLAYRGWISRIGGVLIILFGLYLAGVVSMNFFGRERRVYLATKPAGYAGTMLVGIAFGAGWTPCIGPILGAVLIYTSSAADLNRGLMLLLLYSLGLALPFFLAALAVNRFIDFFTAFRKHMVWVTKASGVLLIVVGVLMVTSEFERLAIYLQGLTPEVLKSRL